MLTSFAWPLYLPLLRLPLAYSQQTGSHTDWPRWCGKVYESGYSSFDPGGQTFEPEPNHGGHFLNVQLMPRMSLYLESETDAEFVVRTSLSSSFGKPLPNAADGTIRSAATTHSQDQLYVHFNITLDGPVQVLASGTVSVSVRPSTTSSIVPFKLSGLKPSLATQNVSLSGWVESLDHSAQTALTTSSELSYLPEKQVGSVIRLDNLYGGFLFRNPATHGQFWPLFPYGFYSSYDGFLAGVSDNASAAAVVGRYKSFGLNAMTPLTHYPESAAAFAYMEASNLKFQFDLRESYTDLPWVADQVTSVHNNSALFSYWCADEPDGHQDPFNAPVDCRDTVRRIDPYHPVAVVLNCQNYYFGPYTAGADVIMEDVYPIGINSTYSKWGTVCNNTLGDCGCDNCIGGAHAIQDVGDRLDDLAQYESWLGLWPKTKIHNPQSFHGEDYWSRDPTAAEAWATTLLAINHGAQGIVSWVYPAPDVLAAAHGQLAAVLSTSPVVDFIVANGGRHRLTIPDTANIDAVLWRRGDFALVSVVNGGYSDFTGPVNIFIPAAVPLGVSVSAIHSIPWGNLTWSWSDSKLSTAHVPALATSIIILSLSQQQ